MRISSWRAAADMPMSDSARRQIEAEFQRQNERPSSDLTSSTNSLSSDANALQEHLWRLIHTDDQLKCYRWVKDYVGAVPQRKFEIDMCIPEYAIGCELDGWAYHGKRKKDFLRDREKDYLLSLQGWQVYRIEAGLLYKDQALALKNIRNFLQTWLPRQKALIAQNLVSTL